MLGSGVKVAVPRSSPFRSSGLSLRSVRVRAHRELPRELRRGRSWRAGDIELELELVEGGVGVDLLVRCNNYRVVWRGVIEVAVAVGCGGDYDCGDYPVPRDSSWGSPNTRPDASPGIASGWQGLTWPSQAQSSGDHHNNNESIQSTVGNIQHPIGTNPEIDYIEPPRVGQAVSIQPP